MPDTPYGVTGCRCWADTGPHVLSEKDIWATNPHCPYHGLLPRDRTDTGVYRVVRGDDGKPTELKPIHDRDGEPVIPPSDTEHMVGGRRLTDLDERLRRGIEQAQRGETVDRGDFTHDDTPDCETCQQYGECLDCQQAREEAEDEGLEHYEQPMPSDVVRKFADWIKADDGDHYPIHRDVTWFDAELNEDGAEVLVCGRCVPRHAAFPTRAAVPNWPCDAARGGVCPGSPTNPACGDGACHVCRATDTVPGADGDPVAIPDRPGSLEWFAEERRRRDAARDEAAERVARISEGLNQRLEGCTCGDGSNEARRSCLRHGYDGDIWDDVKRMQVPVSDAAAADTDADAVREYLASRVWDEPFFEGSASSADAEKHLASGALRPALTATEEKYYWLVKKPAWWRRLFRR